MNKSTTTDISKYCNYVGEHVNPKTNKVYPLYELTGFINIVEGSNALACVYRKEISEADFKAAKVKYHNDNMKTV